MPQNADYISLGLKHGAKVTNFVTAKLKHVRYDVIITDLGLMADYHVE